MGWIMIGLQLISALPALMKVAEQAFDGVPDSGAQKKEMVLTAAQAIVGGIVGLSTGGQADTWKRIQTILDPAIDIMCSFIFPKESAK